MTWQQETVDRWESECFGDPEPLHEALRLATQMVHTALLYPEWGRGFVLLAAGGAMSDEQANARECMEMFPVAFEVSQ